MKPVLLPSDKFQPGACPSCTHSQHVGRRCETIVSASAFTGSADPMAGLCGCSAEAAVKADAGKPHDFRLLAWDAIPEVLEVYHYGIKKGYLRDSWRQVEPQRYEDALVRHTLAILRGEECDPESGLRHIAHATWNALALVVLYPR